MDKSANIKKIEFKEKESYVNFYETDEFLITTLQLVDEIWLTKYKDSNDVPIYRVIASTEMELKPKKEIAKGKL